MRIKQLFLSCAALFFIRETLHKSALCLITQP